MIRCGAGPDFLTTRSHNTGSKDPGKKGPGCKSYMDVKATFARKCAQLLTFQILFRCEPQFPLLFDAKIF